MFKNQRLDKILQMLEEKQHLTVPELMQKLYVSEATARRDIATLEKNNLIVKGYGGISLNNGSNRFVQLSLRQVEHEKEKKAIARLASQLVETGDTLFLDGSSTVLNMIPFLQQKNLTVITNSLRVADLISETNIRLYVTGGQLLESSKVFVGSVAERALQSFHVDRFFFSASGVSRSGDISDYSEMEAQLRHLAIKRSEKQYFLCDSSKFEKHFLFHLGSAFDVTATISEKEYAFENEKGGRIAVLHPAAKGDIYNT